MKLVCVTSMTAPMTGFVQASLLKQVLWLLWRHKNAALVTLQQSQQHVLVSPIGACHLLLC